MHTKLLRALVSDRGGPSSRLNIPKRAEGTGLAHSDCLPGGSDWALYVEAFD